MRVLVACDSFKDALPAAAVCEAIGRGLQEALPAAAVSLLPLADGGEGTTEVLAAHAKATWARAQVSGPLGRPVQAAYARSADRQTAFLEMAAASGLQLLKPEERNPLLTSTFGTGQIIQQVLQAGAKKIVLGLGGSATNDGGIGMAAALGYRFLDASGHEVPPNGGNLIRIQEIDSSGVPASLHNAAFTALCDVDNPLTGPRGATQVYGPQKGASPVQIALLEDGMANLAAILRQTFGKDVSHLPGSGAAGGMGAAFMAFLNGELKPGIQAIMELTGFEQQLKSVDLLITGEGKIDEQTLQGKLISGLCGKAQAAGVPVIAVCGALLATAKSIQDIGLKAAFSIQNRPLSLEEALAETADRLQATAFNIGRLLQQ